MKLHQRYQPGAGWGSTDEDHLLPEDRAPLTGASGLHAIDDLDDIEPSSLGPPSYRWEDEGIHTIDEGFGEGWNAGPWTYAEMFEAISADLPRTAARPASSVSASSRGPKSPKASPRPPPKRPAGVRSRVWWRVMVAADEGMGRKVTRGSRGESLAVGRRKVPHAAVASGGGAAAGGVAKGRMGDRIRVPLEKLRRAVVVGPNTLVVELEVGGGGEWRPATLVVGPCDAARLGSLLIERAATAKPRAALGQVVRKARRLANPPPLPPRPGGRNLGSSAGSGGVGAVAPAAAGTPGQLGLVFWREAFGVPGLLVVGKCASFFRFFFVFFWCGEIRFYCCAVGVEEGLLFLFVGVFAVFLAVFDGFSMKFGTRLTIFV